MSSEIRISQRISRELKASFRHAAKAQMLTEAEALRLIMARFIAENSQQSSAA
jgi:antitoxin component of RelBE/YafQ-DinJ toxin-antitoxin module